MTGNVTLVSEASAVRDGVVIEMSGTHGGAPRRTTGVNAFLAGRSYLLVADVAKIWGQERARARGVTHPVALRDAAPVAITTVWSYLKESKPNGRYGDNPVPAPTHHTRVPMWIPAEGKSIEYVADTLRDWWHSRRGRGAGGGRPWPSVQHSITKTGTSSSTRKAKG
jgi:hypothetical protein